MANCSDFRTLIQLFLGEGLCSLYKIAEANVLALNNWVNKTQITQSSKMDHNVCISGIYRQKLNYENNIVDVANYKEEQAKIVRQKYGTM